MRKNRPTNCIHWSNGDYYFGPFTYAKDESWTRWAIVLNSGDDERPICNIRLSAFGRTLIAALPLIVKPFKEWVDTSKYSWNHGATGGYWNTENREYGISYGEGFLNVYLGRQSHDSSTEQRWSCFIPWTQWRFVRWSFYDLEGKHFWTEPRTKKRKKQTDKERRTNYDVLQSAKDSCPKATFAFADFDGDQLTVETRLEEREWKFGEGCFKWLSIFRKPKIVRALDLHFSGETGRKKGSWKGGTIGHGIDVLPGELHEAAFRRYCLNHEMIFGSYLQKSEPQPV